MVLVRVVVMAGEVVMVLVVVRVVASVVVHGRGEKEWTGGRVGLFCVQDSGPGSHQKEASRTGKTLNAPVAPKSAKTRKSGHCPPFKAQQRRLWRGIRP
jgi:hypothetical protein